MSDIFNIDKQHTIKDKTSINGTGLHTGINVDMTLIPASPGFGIQFRRTDLIDSPLIKADCDLVSETSRGTTLQVGDIKINTVEHILAALTGMGVDNVLIELNAPEVPIMDGSSQPFIEMIDSIGIVEQEATKIWYSIEENIYHSDVSKRVEMVALPANKFEVTTLIDFNSPTLGTQHASLNNLANFKNDIAPCRTFCFLHELETLLENNLIKGGDLNNAIVVVDKQPSADTLVRLSHIFKKEKVEYTKDGYLNNIQLRYPNEPARHKLLDVIGDLTLIGYPIKAKIIANRPGHSTNVEFAKKIKDYIKKNKINKNIPIYNPTIKPIYDINAIEKILPHRIPFILVDKIIELTDKMIIGIKNVTYNEWFFNGHFPNNPVMPGVLQVEALAQTGGILCINFMASGSSGSYDTYFLKIDNCKFKQIVRPGDTLLLKMELISPIRRGICEMKGTVYVGNKIVTEADLVAQIIKKN